MAKRKKDSETAPSKRTLFGYPAAGFIHWDGATGKRADGPPPGKVLVAGAGTSLEQISKELGPKAPTWLLQESWARGEESVFLPLAEGPAWVVRPRDLAKVNDSQSATKGKAPAPQHHGLLQVSPFGRFRDLAGLVTRDLQVQRCAEILLSFLKTGPEEELGFKVGLELGMYRFLRASGEPRRDQSGTRPVPDTLVVNVVSSSSEALQTRATALSTGVNIARHLTNLPAQTLNPETFAGTVADFFAKSKQITCEVWDEKRLEREKMGLLLGVGQAAAAKPRLLILRYRPARGASKAPKVALVGKGVTFDSGGLDIKTADGMRLMKKDMGGAAALVGFGHYLDQSSPGVACDIYLALAENAIGPQAMRPGDVLRARNGLSVEISNTDAEGRLVLADALDVALTDKDASAEPDMVINVATLTGAIKVALGTKLAGLFSNHDDIAEKLLRAGQTFGDPCWRMPLYQEYFEQHRSSFADFTNSSNSRFGGAVTAALFLSKFVRDKPWAHLDIYSWADCPQGAIREEGATGQGVQLLAAFFENLAGD